MTQCFLDFFFSKTCFAFDIFIIHVLLTLMVNWSEAGYTRPYEARLCNKKYGSMSGEELPITAAHATIIMQHKTRLPPLAMLLSKSTKTTVIFEP